MVRVCIISENEYEALNQTGDFMRLVARTLGDTEGREQGYTAANIFEGIVSEIWDNGLELTPEMIEELIRIKEEKITNAA